MCYYIYKYMIDDVIIYIGKTKRKLSMRIDEHAREIKFLQYRSRADIYWFECDSQIEMDIAERILILRYRPILNVVDNQDVVLKNTEFTEPVWRAYRDWIDFDVDHCISDTTIDPPDKQDELEGQDVLWQNFESWLEYMFDVYLNTDSSAKIQYMWDLDLYPLPDFVTINENTYSCYHNAVKIGMSYDCCIRADILSVFLKYGKQVCAKMRMQITEQRLRW